MMNLYGVLKFLHVLSVAVWVGGVAALWITTLRVARAGDYPTVAQLLPIGMRYGQSVVAPASGIALITGIWMAISRHLFKTTWVAIGMTGILLLFILGGTLVRTNWLRIGKLIDDPNRDPELLSAAITRTTTTSWVYLLIMFVVIAAMVLKP